MGDASLYEKSDSSGGPRRSKATRASIPYPRPGMVAVTWFPCLQALRHRRSTLSGAKPKGHETTLMQVGLGKCKHENMHNFFSFRISMVQSVNWLIYVFSSSVFYLNNFSMLQSNTCLLKETYIY